MPISKALKAKLTALLKEGNELPEELEAMVAFDNEGQFLAETDRKAKSKIEAEVKKAREATIAQVVEDLGLTKPEEIAEMRAKLEAATSATSELDKSKSQVAKLEKKLADALKENGALLGFKTDTIKRGALDPHLEKIHPEFRDLVRDAHFAKFTVSEDGSKVIGPDNSEPGSYFDELIKAKPGLKRPDFKAGGGTGPGGNKADGRANGAGNGAGNGSGNGSGGGNGTGNEEPKKPKDIREAVVQGFIELQRKAEAEKNAGGL